MRYFALLNFQHVILYFFPALIFVVLLGLSLGYSAFHRTGNEERRRRIIQRYPSGIEERNAPFPLVLILIIAGTLVWALGYTLAVGLLQVRI
ncbi:MAG: hypothetical protein V2L15_10955 [Desulfobacteraceae bacterium]|jgi:hypothetical protein|nr:hypothetical protein [Desulfobacteraceae bacterium]